MSFEYEIINSTKNIDFAQVNEILHFHRLSKLDDDQQEKAFKNSYAVVFLKKGEELIGVGRVISDGICQAALCNIAVRDEYRGNGLGQIIVEQLLKQVDGCNVTLYTNPSHQEWYRYLGFSKMKTAFAMYQNEEDYRQGGFIE